MLSHHIFLLVVLLVVIQRLAELLLSRYHEKKILASGGFEHAPEHFKWMGLLHGTWLLSMMLEVNLLNRPYIWALALPSLTLFLIGQALRITAIATLKHRWTAKIMVLPEIPVVKTGIYRWCKHPNYIGVVLEIAFLPLIHSAYITAILFSLLNGLLLWIRIGYEEQVLTRYCGFKTHHG